MTEEEKKAAEAKAAADKAAADAAAAAATKSQPFATFETSEQFNARLEREARSLLKKQGINPDTIGADLAALAKLRADEAAAEEAKKSEIQRAAEAKVAAEAKAEAAMSEAEEARMRAHLYRTFAEQGVKNFDYAFFAVQGALAKLGEAEELDEVDFVKKLMADPSQAAALGIAAPPAPPKVEGVTTTGAGAKPDPVPGSPTGDAKPPADAFAQTGEQFRAGVAAKYGFTPPV